MTSLKRLCLMAVSICLGASGAWAYIVESTVIPSNGPSAGGNEVVVTNVSIPVGNGSDITNVVLTILTFRPLTTSPSTTNILGQGTNWVRFVAPASASAGWKNIFVQSTSEGLKYVGDYTYNPAGEIGGTNENWNSWQEVAGLPAARGYLAAGVLNGALYAIGGEESGVIGKTNVYQYNGTDWTEVAGLPEARRYLAAGVLNGALYAVGGDEDNNVKTNAYQYDGTNWTEAAGLPAPRFSLAAGTLSDALYAVGGYYGGSRTNVYQYDGTNWAEVAGLPAERHLLAAGVLNGALYAVGGYYSGSGVTNVYRYDGTNWTEAAGLPTGLCNLAAAVLNDGLYAIGGEDAVSYSVRTNVYRYDGTNWSEVAGLPAKRQNLAAGVLNGALYAVGGVDGNAKTNVYRYPTLVSFSGVEPSSGSVTGGYPVVIVGTNLCDGTDVTNVTICGVNAASIDSKSITQVVVTAGAGTPGLGDVRVFSTSYGETIKSNAFTYTGGVETNLPTPVIVSATYGTYTNMVRITWTGVAGATSYEILRNTTNDANGATVLADVPAEDALVLNRTASATTHYYDDYTVVARLSYYYWVRALSSSGVSALSYVGMGYAELGSGQTGGRADLTVSDMVFLPVNLTNGSPAGTVSYRLANGGPDTLTAAPVRFDFYMIQGDQEVWMAFNETNVTLAMGTDQLYIPDASARQGMRVRGDLTGQYNVQARARHLALIGDGHTGSNMTAAAGSVRIKASGVNSPGRSVNDYDGDGKSDGGLYQSTLGRWYAELSGVRYAEPVWIGDIGIGWTPVPGDYDGDGITDVAAYDRANGQWLALLSSNGQLLNCPPFGGPDFTAVQCDIDGDAKTDPVVYREADGYCMGAASSRGYAPCYAYLGITGYQPVMADYDGDGLADPAVYNRETGLWGIAFSSIGYQVMTGTFGGLGYLPVTADYDGDGLADRAVYDSSTGEWQAFLSGSGYNKCWGMLGSTGLPVPADYDGDGLADPAVYHQDTGIWGLFLSTRGYHEFGGGFGGPEYSPATE